MHSLFITVPSAKWRCKSRLTGRRSLIGSELILSGLVFLAVDASHASTVCTMSLVTFFDLFQFCLCFEQLNDPKDASSPTAQGRLASLCKTAKKLSAIASILNIWGAYEEPHRGTESSCAEPVEGSCCFDMSDRVVAGPDWFRHCGIYQRCEL